VIHFGFYEGVIFSAESLMRLPYIIAALLPALTFHEWGHAMMATRYGDNTPRQAGRLTLNPMAHLDPLGTIVLLVTGFFGWAKPVPVNPAFFKGSWGSFWVASAGPMMNIALAIVCALLYRSGIYNLLGGNYAMATATILQLSITMNLGLAFFNLLPIGPLDGSHMLERLLPLRQSISFSQWNLRYGGTALFMGIIVDQLLNLRILSTILGIPVAIFQHLLLI
jgi:Zn-dependent protease